jgi:hypothetical protein
MWLPDETDCGKPEIKVPCKWLVFPGYGICEATTDRSPLCSEWLRNPICCCKKHHNNKHINVKGPIDSVQWIQITGKLWHDRLMCMSPNGSQNCIGNHVITIPPLSLFSDNKGVPIGGMYLPEDIVPEEGNICIVSMQFTDMGEEREEGLQLIHLSTTTASAFRSKCDRGQVPSGHFASISSAWTLGAQEELIAAKEKKRTRWLSIRKEEKKRAIIVVDDDDDDDDPPSPAPNKKRKKKRDLLFFYHGATNRSFLRPSASYQDGIVVAFTPNKDEAVEFATSRGLAVFGYDFYPCFAKKFVVCSYPMAYRIIFKRQTYTMPASQDLYDVGWKCMYEGMLPHYPHKPILDMEFEKEANPQWTNYPEDADRVTLATINYVSKLLNAVVALPNKEITHSDWLIIEADSDKKVSRHAILNIPGGFFKSTIVACRFRDIVKQCVEAGVVLGDKETLDIMVRVNLKLSEETLAPLSVRDSVAEQCFFEEEGVWKTCMMDWCVLTKTFRLMRPYGCTKFGQERFLKVSAINALSFDEEKNDSIRQLKEAFGMTGEVSHDWIAFMTSMIHAVYPQEAPGWDISESDMWKHCESLTSMALEKWTEEDLRKRIHFLTTGTHVTTTTTTYCHGGGGGKVSKRVSSRNHSDIAKEAIYESDPIFERVINALSHIEELKPIVATSNKWRVYKCYSINDHNDSRDKGIFEEKKWWYSAKPNTEMCPISGAHRKGGKAQMIQLNPCGSVTATCLAGKCANLKWKSKEFLKKGDIKLLWG